MTQLQKRLKGSGACKEAIDWVGERDLATAWTECERADWMLWLAGRMSDKPGYSTSRDVLLTGITCGRISLEYAGVYRDELAKIFDIAERCASDPTLENITAAESAAQSAYSATQSAAGSAAGSAAWSAAWSAESAARSAAWRAAESAYSAAQSAAWSAAWRAAQIEMCGIVRLRLTIPGGI